MRTVMAGAWLAAGLAVAGAAPASAAGKEKLDGYAEWRREAELIVDGQRVRAGANLRFDGKGAARDFASIPLGYEVEVEGERAADGALVARRVTARPNGDAMFEGALREAFDEAESKFRSKRRMFQEDGEHGLSDLGALYEEGPDVERVRAIAEAVAPPYLHPEDFRYYVVENEEWNAMAAPNGSIYVFTGLLDALDDDELAIVLGHELAHVTHEHSRKGMKKSIPVVLGAAALGIAADSIDDDGKRIGVKVLTWLTAMALTRRYDRWQEDQADRAGLRYAHEAGYDVSKGPALWERFARRYGELPSAVNFFVGSHTRSSDRAARLRREIRLNY